MKKLKLLRSKADRNTFRGNNENGRKEDRIQIIGFIRSKGNKTWSDGKFFFTQIKKR